MNRYKNLIIKSTIVGNWKAGIPIVSADLNMTDCAFEPLT